MVSKVKVNHIMKRDRGNLPIIGRFLLDLVSLGRCACDPNQSVVRCFPSASRPTEPSHSLGGWSILSFIDCRTGGSS